MALRNIGNSLVLNRADSQYLSDTPGAPTDATTWTFSAWFKRGRNVADNSAADTILSAGTGVNDYTQIGFENDDTFRFDHVVASSVIDRLTSNATFRDPTAWYHLVIRYDSNEAVAADRIRIWINNVLLTSFSTANYPTSAASSFVNTAVAHNIGRRTGPNDDEYDGYLADIFFCDGETLSPTDFAELQDDTWQPRAGVSVTFGNNGYFLEFSTDSDLGEDSSVSVNDWTENATDASNQRDDTPTSNHVTWNPSYLGVAGVPDPTIREGGLQYFAESNSTNICFATSALPKTGKYYWEIDCVVVAGTLDIIPGVASQLSNILDTPGNNNQSWSVANTSGTVLENFHNGVLVPFTDTGTFQTGDYLMFAFDTATGELWFGLNGSWLDSGDPGAGSNPVFTITDAFNDELIPCVRLGTMNNRIDFRAGAEDFEGSIPTGFNTLDTSTWPDLTIEKPSDYFDVVAYSGDNTSPRAFTGFDFQPDLGWVKSIGNVSDHILSDDTKGAGTIHNNNAPTIADDAAELDGEISAFAAAGFSVQDGGTGGSNVNASGRDYMAFMWREAVLAGLDLVGYAGTAAPQAIAHSLGVTPDAMYVRNRDSADDNYIYARNIADSSTVPVSDPETDYFRANTTNIRTDDVNAWNDVDPSASDFTVGSATPTNSNGENHQAYLWAGVEGFSKFTTYFGNGNLGQDSTFVYLGFRPKLAIIKRISTVDDWAMLVRDNGLTGPAGGTDATDFWRSNLTTGMVSPSGSIAADFCGTGINFQSGDGEFNAGDEYLIWAWAEVPFQLASSTGAAPSPGAGAIDLAIQIDATGDLPNQHGDGTPEIALVIDATGDLPNQHGAGALDIAIVIEGQGTNVNRHGDGALDLAFVLDGAGDYPGEFGDGAMDLAIELAGAGSNPGKHGAGQLFMVFDLTTAAESGDDGGSISMPPLQTTGTIVSAFPLIGEARIPQLQVVATIDNPPVGTGNILMPKLQVQGEINPDTNINLPLLQVQGVMVPGRTYSGSPRIPFLQVVGAGISPQPIEGAIRLPQLRVLGEILPGAIITENAAGGLILPQLQVEGFLFIPNLGTGSILLPALDIDPLSFIAAGSIGGGSVTLPFVRVEGIVVNGVALTATVWAMNTETFETTNYLNFDFESLVSFNEQPYGVTSSGIFLLEGDDDDGTDINARILTGISDRGDENLSEVAQLYLQYEGQSVILQLFPDGQQKIREYEIVRRSNSSGLIHARAKGARGLRSRSWQMGFRNLSGGDFTFDKMGLLIRQLTRKTRKN